MRPPGPSGGRSFNRGTMKKTGILSAALLLLAACAYKLPESQVIKIFERHSFKEHDPVKLQSLIREKGLAGLKMLDKHAAVLRSKPRVKVSRETLEPSAGMLPGGDFLLLRVFKGSPAEAAGLRDGDRLLTVNGLVPGQEGFIEAITGPEPFSVKAARRSKTDVTEFEAEVSPDEFRLPRVFGLYEPQTRAAFVRVGLFFPGSADLAAAGLSGLMKSGAKNIILDLRGNPGGNPEEAAALLNLFAPGGGPVLALASRHEGYSRVYKAGEKGKFSGIRTVVLVDGSTAMAGEVFAASLRELAGATVVGARTRGNVSVQKTFGLSEERGLSLTVARLVTPAGLDLEGAGLDPDIPTDAPQKPAWSANAATALQGDAAWGKTLELLGAARTAGRRP